MRDVSSQASKQTQKAAAAMKPGGYLMIDGSPRRITQVWGTSLLLEGGKLISTKDAQRYRYAPPGGDEKPKRQGLGQLPLV